MDVLNNDALMKKLNESTINIHTVEIQSTCEVHQVLKKFSLLSFLEVLRIRENSLKFKDVSYLRSFLKNVCNQYELDLCHTKFKESSFLAFICALHHCKNLTSLILTDNRLTEEEINGLITVFESVKNLKTLKLSKCILTETQANAILHQHEQAKNIVSLDLSHNAIQGNEIIVGICQLQFLQELNLSHNRVRFSPLPNLEGKHDHLSTCMKVISLSSNYMKPHDIFQFCSLIRSDLSKLILDFNHIGHSIWLLRSLGGSIKHLSLASTNICDNVDGLISLLSFANELEDLNLSFNNLLPEDFQQLQTPLSKLTQLKTLNLSMNAIGPDGLKALADIFNKFPLLERLDMSSSYIREDEVSVLCERLVSIKKLKYLNLSGNCIDVEVLDDALVLPATLEELLFSDIIHGEKLFSQMKPLQNLKKLYLNKFILRACDVEALVIMLPCFLKLEELSLADLVVPEYETILTAIKSLKNIRKIDLTGVKLSNERALVDMLSSRKFFEELVLTGINGTAIDYERLFSAIKLLKGLRKLSLGGVRVSGGVNAFIGIFSSLPILEDILFPDLSLIDADSITACFEALKSLRYLRSLDLGGTVIRESTTGALACVLPSLQLLEKLALTTGLCSDDNESEKELFAGLGKLKNLRELLIKDTRISSVNGLANVLPSLRLLEKVDLDFLERDRLRKLLLEAPRELRYVKEFSYSMTFQDSDIEAHALSSLPLLEKLTIITTQLSNTEYVGQLYAAISKLKYLRKLDLFIVNNTNDSEAEAFAKALPSLELLEELRLDWTISRLVIGLQKQVFAAIGKLKYLKELDYCCPFGAYTDVKAFGEMLTSLPLLQKLVFSEFECKNDREKKELFIAVGKLKHLKTLTLGTKINQANVKGLARPLLSLQVLENLQLKCIYDINEIQGEELLTAVGKLKYLKKLTLNWEKMTPTNVDALVRELASLQVLEELTLDVYFYCNHDCDDSCEDECDHDCYGNNCNYCRHDEHKRKMDLTKEKVLEVWVEKFKYLKEFTLNKKHVISKGELQVA